MRGHMSRESDGRTRLMLECCPICGDGHEAPVGVFEERMLIGGHDYLCFSLCPNSKSQALALKAVEGDDVSAIVVDTPQGVLRKSI